jgi:hypothetical protein
MLRRRFLPCLPLLYCRGVGAAVVAAFLRRFRPDGPKRETGTREETLPQSTLLLLDRSLFGAAAAAASETFAPPPRTTASVLVVVAVVDAGAVVR